MRTAQPKATHIICIIAAFILICGMADDRTKNSVPQVPAFKVVVNVSVPDSVIHPKYLSRLFLKKITRWPDGGKVMPVDQPETTETRLVFTEQIHKKDISAIKAYWQIQIFSGRAVPPPEKQTDDAVIQYVKDHPGAIGYISSRNLAPGMKVLKVVPGD